MANRPPLPRPLAREIKSEAGFKCAIPTCRQTPCDIAHIEPRKPDGSNDTYDNLILLCKNHHASYDQTKEIDRKALRAYKEKLVLINSRYGDIERRVLDVLKRDPDRLIQLDGTMDIFVMYLLEDGLITETQPPIVQGGQTFASFGETPVHRFYALTDHGRSFLARWQDPSESLE